MKEIFNYPEEEMEKCTISQDPKVAIFTDNRSAAVCFDFGETTDENLKMSEDEEPRIVHYCTRIRVPKLDYDTIVSEIVTSFYNNDEVEAIMSNYINVIDSSSTLTINDGKKEEYKKDWNTFQELRAKAKEIATIVVNVSKE